MQTSSRSRSFGWLNATQFLGALNDNITKLLVILFLIHRQGMHVGGRVAAVAGALFVLPFLLLTPAAGVLADRCSKRNVIVATKALEIAIMLGLALSFAVAQPALIGVVLFCMAAQSALFGPSKYGIVAELVGTENLSRANGSLLAATFLAVILGTAMAPLLAEQLGGDYVLAAAWCVAIAVAGTLTSLAITRTAPAGSTSTASVFFVRDVWRTLRSIRHDRELLLTVLAVAYFYIVGAFMQLNLIPYGMEVLGLNEARSGYLFLLAALGIGTGALLAGQVSGRNIEFGIVPLGALGLTLCACGLGTGVPRLTAVLPLIFGVGLTSGLFVLPLEAFIQYRSPAARRGQILAASGFVSWIGVLLASGLLYGLNCLPGFRAAHGFLVIGVLTGLLTLCTLRVLPDFLLRFLVLLLVRVCYRLRVRGREHVPADGPALLVSNHVSWADAFILLATQQRRIRFVMGREFYERRLLRPLFRLMGAIPISDQDRPRQVLTALRAARTALDDGYLVCIFAEGAVTRTGMMRGFRPGLERILARSTYPVIPVHLGGLWGSIFSYYRGRLLAAWPSRVPYPVSVIFGAPLPATATAWQIRQAVMELGAVYADSRKAGRQPMFTAFVRVARQHWRRLAVADSSGRRLSFGQTLTGALALAEVLRRHTAGQARIGILLPPAAGAALAHLAVSALHRLPVNLNYTAAHESLLSAVQQCDIRTVISSRKFLEKLEGCPLPEGVVFLEDLLLELRPAVKARAWLRARWSPARALGGGRQFRPDDIATILFSSGSTGTPKGIQLTHHNLLSNLEAFGMVLRPTARDCMCSALPLSARRTRAATSRMRRRQSPPASPA